MGRAVDLNLVQDRPDLSYDPTPTINRVGVDSNSVQDYNRPVSGNIFIV